MGTFLAVADAPPPASETSPQTPSRPAVIAVSSNKGGVGKTTVASNLAVYLRALREDLPVAVIGLDDQGTIDRMFALGPPRPGDGNLKHGWAERSFDRVLQLGEYGVHYVPSPPDLVLLKARAENPTTLRSILDHTDWDGIFILDTKSDLEALTINALHAADLVLVPVSDRAALEEAGRHVALLERGRLGVERIRIVFTLVDRRARVEVTVPLLERLREEVRRRGWPFYRTVISRSPRVEALNSGTKKPLSILHHARGTAVHAEFRELTEEILWDLARLAPRARRPAAGPPAELWGRRLDVRAPMPTPTAAGGSGTTIGARRRG